MGLFDFIGDILGMSPPSAGQSLSKEDMAWLMDHGLQGNRVDQFGLFTNSTWDDDKTTQTTAINDAIRPAFDNFLGRVNSAPEAYQNPFGGLLESMMASRGVQPPAQVAPGVLSQTQPMAPQAPAPFQGGGSFQGGPRGNFDMRRWHEEMER